MLNAGRNASASKSPNNKGPMRYNSNSQPDQANDMDEHAAVQ